MPFFRALSLGAEVGYHLAPLDAKDVDGKAVDSVSIITVGPVLGLRLEFLERIGISAYLKGGYFYTFLNSDPGVTGGNPYVGGGIGASVRLSPRLSLGVDAAYRKYFYLYSGLSFPLSLSFDLGRSGAARERTPVKRPSPLKEAVDEKLEETSVEDGEGLDITAVEFENVFTVFFKYYFNNPIGTVTIKNFESVPVSNVKVSFFVKQYMDNPKEAAIIDELASAEERDIDIFGLFTDNVLDITEDTKVSALIKIDYVREEQEQSKEFIETVRLHNRNAVTWDDDQKACAFVTAKDPVVLKFSKNVVGWVKNDLTRAVNDNLETAIALHEALDLYGISYIPDPTTPYIEFSQNKLAIDYLQFPKQTLDYLAGDCDDLSILYSALLEAAGIETAFVTTPGHIFVAFNLDMSAEDAQRSFLYPDDLIIREGKAWIPVEITDRGRGFLRAWQTGAKEWRESAPSGRAGFYPMHAAWELYEPVGFPGDINLVLPDRAEIAGVFGEEVQNFIRREMEPQLAQIERQIRSNQGDVRYINRLGVLYARYGLDEDAMEQFEAILEQREYVPALLNLGSLYFIQDELKEAREYYERAYELAPDNAKVLLSYARINHELENYGSVREAYSRLKEKSPELADKYAYLEQRGEEAARAADTANVKGAVEWEVEE